MRQLFAPGADAIFRLYIFTVFGGLLVISVALIAYANSDYIGGVGIAPPQPVPFSHKHHSGELGLDCRNCHQQVTENQTSGLPPTHTCMTCHSQIWTGSDMLKPVRDSLADNEPLQWARVNRLPNYVYFNHSAHITSGVGCSTCHGQVNEMQLTYRAQSFTMQWCIECHREPQSRLRPAAQVWNMEWTPPANQAEIGAELARLHKVPGPEWMTQCSTCHR